MLGLRAGRGVAEKTEEWLQELMSGDERLAEPPLLTLEFSSFIKAAERRKLRSEPR